MHGTQRQLFGQVTTPHDIAEAMTDWVLAAPAAPRTLLEPGSGGFVFGRAALRRSPGIEVTGIDIDPRAGLAPLAAQLIIGDFLEDVFLEGRQFDAVLCNPPYVRHQHLKPSYKARISRQLGERAGLALSRLSGTHVYFILRSLELLAPGGRAAFITSAEWLETSYGEPLRRHLAASGWLRAVLVARPDAGIFPDVLSSAMVLLIERAPAGGRGVRFAADLDEHGLVELIATGGAGAPLVEDLGGGRWTHRAPRPGRPTLGSLFRVRRGVATGHNAFFVLTAERARELRLPARHLRPCLVGPRDLEPRRLLCVRRGAALGRALRAYLDAGEFDGVHERYLCRAREPWYCVEEVAPAPLLVGYMARSGVRVVDNRDGAVHLNLLHGVYPRPGTPARLVARLRRYLSSPAGQEAARTAARHYAGGLLKLEPRDLEAVELPEDF